MICKNCGAEIADDDIFCQDCGCRIAGENTDEENTGDVSDNVSPVTEEAVREDNEDSVTEAAKAVNEDTVTGDTPHEEAAPNERQDVPTSDEGTDGNEASVSFFKSHGIIIAAAAAALVLIVVLICLTFAVFGGSGAFLKPSDDFPYTVFSDDETLIFSKTKQIGKVDGSSSAYYYSSSDGSVIVLESGDELYCAASSKVQKISSDVQEHYMAASGNSVAYISDDSLYLYNVSSSESEKIASDASLYAISPDGKSVVYTDEDGKCMVYSSGKSTEIDGKEIYPLAVSDKAKYLYYAKNGNLYVYKDGEEVKLANDSYGYLFLNMDGSEIVFSADNNLYISKDGGDKQKLASDITVVRFILPESSSRIVYGKYCEYYPFETFDKKVMNGGKALRYVALKKNEWSAEKITSDPSAVALSEDGNKLAYIKKDNIYLADNLSKSLEGEKIADEAVSMVCSSDMSDIYFISLDDELKYINSAEKYTKIGDDVISAVMSDSGDVFFLVEDSEMTSVLYSCRNKKSKEKVENGESTIYLYNEYPYVFFIECDEDNEVYNVYIHEKGDKFTCIVKDAELY